MKIHFKEKSEKDLHSFQKHQPPPLSFLPFTTASTPIWSPKGFWDGARPGEESGGGELGLQISGDCNR